MRNRLLSRNTLALALSISALALTTGQALADLAAGGDAEAPVTKVTPCKLPDGTPYNCSGNSTCAPHFDTVTQTWQPGCKGKGPGNPGQTEPNHL